MARCPWRTCSPWQREFLAGYWVNSWAQRAMACWPLARGPIWCCGTGSSRRSSPLGRAWSEVARRVPQSKTAATRGTPPTIVDVAKRAGVATSTASRAFNHPRLLKEETVSRVRNAADEIGYHRNRNARALSTGRPAALGLIVPDLSNPFFPPLVHAAQVQAESKGYSLYILSSEHEDRKSVV